MKFETDKIGQPLTAQSHEQSVGSYLLPKNKSIGSKFIIGAWIFEILAFMLGLSIAFSLVNKTGNGMETSQSFWNSIVIGSGLVMVALAELAKVPFSIAVYRIKSILGKTLCIIALIVAVTATFLNVYRALDQFYAEREYSIQNTRDQIETIDNQLKVKEEKIEINNAEIEDLKTSIKDSKNNYEEELSIIENNYTQGRENIFARYKAQLTSVQSSIKNLEAKISSNAANEIEALKSVKRRSQQDKVRKEYAEERENLNALLGKEKENESIILGQISKEMEILDQKKADALDDLSREYKDQKNPNQAIEQSIANIRESNKEAINEIDSLKELRIEKTSALASLVFDLETYRIAKNQKGYKSATEVSSEEAGRITTILCMVFAAIPSLTGVFMAFFGVVLQEQKPFDISKNRRMFFKIFKRLLGRTNKKQRINKKQKVGYRFNALLVALRRKILKKNVKEKVILKDKIIEVPVKEIVEVEKIVEINNEVPRVIEKEVIVEVPKVEVVDKFIGIPVPQDHDYFMSKKHEDLKSSNKGDKKKKLIPNLFKKEATSEQYS